MSDSANERRLGHGDREVFKAASTGDGLIALTPELLDEMCVAAARTRDAADEMFVDLTADQAALVRRLRVDEDYSWRAVAETCYIEWSGDWSPPSNQLVGMAICERAAMHFGERYMEEPWN